MQEASHTGSYEPAETKNMKVVLKEEVPDAQVAQMMQQSEEDLDTFAEMALNKGTLSPEGSVS